MGYKCIQKSQWFILPYVTIWSGPEAAAPPACKLPVGTLHAQICGRPQPRPTWARSWQGSPPCQPQRVAVLDAPGAHPWSKPVAQATCHLSVCCTLHAGPKLPSELVFEHACHLVL